MSWKTLIDSMVQLPMEDDIVGCNRNEQTLKEVLEVDPAIYWYPGSGNDLAPLVLDVPRNPTKRRLFPLHGARQGKPLLLWMNDYNDSFAGFPDQREYRVKLGDVQATVEITESPGRSVIPAGRPPGNKRATAIPVTVFKARVMGVEPARRRRSVRPPGGDLYTVFYSAAESENLLRSIFVPHCIPIQVVALVRQGGFSDQRLHFEQYQDIKRLLENFRSKVGKVQAYLADNEVQIPNYERFGQPFPGWGYNGVQMWFAT
jgi:hypothetical protein